MNKEEIAPGIVVYSNVIPNSENLYKEIEEGINSAKIEWQGASVKEADNVRINNETRNTLTIGIPYLAKIDKELSTNFVEEFNKNLNNLFFEHFDLIEKDYLSFYGINSNWHDQYGILKYGKGQFFTNHIDDHPDYHRRVSTLYYMNDDYVGGEINFPRFNLSIKPMSNQMIMFPSTYVYNHSVSPVTEGERYAVVSWMR
jgi:hypothetical protein